jgi:hypothetical protein
MEIKGLHTKFWSENLKGRDFLEDLDVNGRIFCKWILNKYDGRMWNGFV